jgi:hypothetical protein
MAQPNGSTSMNGINAWFAVRIKTIEARGSGVAREHYGIHMAKSSHSAAPYAFMASRLIRHTETLCNCRLLIWPIYLNPSFLNIRHLTEVSVN